MTRKYTCHGRSEGSMRAPVPQPVLERLRAPHTQCYHWPAAQPGARTEVWQACRGTGLGLLIPMDMHAPCCPAWALHRHAFAVFSLGVAKNMPAGRILQNPICMLSGM